MPRYLLLVLVLCTSCLISQNKTAELYRSRIDSVKKEFLTGKEDTVRARSFLMVSIYFVRLNNYDSALHYAKRSLDLSTKLNFERGRLMAHSRLGNILDNVGEIFKAMQHYEQAKVIAAKLKDTIRLASVITNMGNIYQTRNEYPKAIKHYFEALKLTQDKKTHAIVYSNLGNSYNKLRVFDKAKEYYDKALQMNTELNLLSNVAAVYGSLGNLEQYLARDEEDSLIRLKRYRTSLTYYFKAAELAQKLNEKIRLSIQYGNIGLTYVSIGKTDSAMMYHEQALKIDQELGDRGGVARHSANIADVYYFRKDYKEAEKRYYAAREMDRELGFKDFEMTIEMSLLRLYEVTGDYKKALECHRRAIVLKDSIFNEGKLRETTQLESQYEFDKQQAVAEAEHKNELSLAAEREKRQMWFSITAAAFLVLVLIFSLFLYKRYKLTQKQKGIIEDQKRLVEHKQKEILDSINYAKRIQQSILPKDKFISGKIKSNRN